MINADEVLDYFLDSLASRIVAKLSERDGSSWPNTESKPKTSEDDVKEFIERLDSLRNDSGAEDPGDAIVIKQPEPEEPSRMAVRTEHWMGVDVRKLRKLLMDFEGETAEHYKSYSKADLADYAARLEALTGHDLDEEKSEEESNVEAVSDAPEEPTDSVDSSEDDDLTYEELLRMDLAEVKEIALANGIEADSLKGLDIDAIADLLFAEEPELDINDLLNMDMTGLMNIVNSAKLTIPEDISRQDLALLIVDKLGN